MNERVKPESRQRVWLLLDDRAGNRAQCLGVAAALGLPWEARELRYGPPAALPNVLLGASFAGLKQESRALLAAPWPDLIVAAGRRTAPVARRIKRMSGGRTVLVHLMHPGGGLVEFDLVAVPRHDARRPGPNVLEITGAPHRLTAQTLADAKAVWEPRLCHLPRPRIALIVGGSTRRRAFTDDMGEDLGRRANALARQAGGSLMVTTSRRTGAAVAPLLREVRVPAHVYRWGDGGENSYLGYLALADGVIVTGDSASMASEACATTGPVYIYAPPALTVAKHGRLHDELYRAGYARPLGETFETWRHPPLNPAEDVARAVLRLLRTSA